jgi:hypothetical protein
MNDKELYEYLVSIPEDLFDAWLEEATDEQLDLADKLFDEAKLEKQDTVEDLTLAKNLLKKFTLGV